MAHHTKEIVYFIYDGECPICQMGASFYKVRNNVGEVQAIDARSARNHPVMVEVKEKDLNVDDGMVIKYRNHFYQGAEALQLMAQLGADGDFLNKLNNTLHKSKGMASISYPLMKGVRNLLLKFKGVAKINVQDSN